MRRAEPNCWRPPAERTKHSHGNGAGRTRTASNSWTARKYSWRVCSKESALSLPRYRPARVVLRNEVPEVLLGRMRSSVSLRVVFWPPFSIYRVEAKNIPDLSPSGPVLKENRPCVA
jgi:hypothetical protein